MRAILKSATIAAGLGLAYLLAWPVPIAPEVYHPAPNPGLTGSYVPNTKLTKAERLPLPKGGDGPEDYALLPSGLYTAGTHGGLYRLEGSAFEKVTDLGGRPLGLDEGPDGKLYIADSFKGILRWSPEDGLETLATEIDGTPITYADQVELAADGTLYFTDSTTRFDPETNGGTKAASVMTIFEQSTTGYVARITPEGQISKVAEGFVFPNGIALSQNEDFLVIAETGRAMLHRLWLKGPEEGTVEPFVSELPAYPDNVEQGENGSFWVAFASPRVPAEALMPYPLLRKVLWRLGPTVRPDAIHHGIIAQYDANGQLIRVLQDASGELGITSGAKVIDNTLYIGLLEGPFGARLPLGN